MTTRTLAGLGGGLALATLVLCLGLVSPPAAHADARTDARRFFRDGMALVASGQVDRGIELLQRAYDTLPHPNVLYNIARAYADAGQYEQAIEYYHQYLDSDPVDREEVEGFIHALQTRIRERQAREAGPGERPAPAPPAPPPTATGPGATEEDLSSLEEAATQIATLAEATQSDALRQRAQRLHTLAESLRERATAASPLAPAPADGGLEGAAPTPDAGAERGGGPTPPELRLGRLRTEETFEERVVSSARISQSPLDAPNSTSIVTEQDVRLTGLTGIDGLLRRVAGVDMMEVSPGGTDLAIRGFNQRLSNRVIVLIDGRSVYIDALGFTPWRILPIGVEEIDRIEVIRGPASALYGANSFGGIINIIPRRPGEGRSGFGLGYGMGDHGRAWALFTGRGETVRYRVSAGYQQADQWTLDTAAARVDRSTPRIVDASTGYSVARADADFEADLGRGFRTRWGAGVTTGDFTFQALGILRQYVFHADQFSQMYAQVTSPWGLSLRVYYNAFGGDFGPYSYPTGGDASQGRIDSNVVDSELTLTREVTTGPIGHNVALGLSHRLKTVSWDYLDADHSEHHFALFLQDSLTFSRRLSALVSFRADRHPLIDHLVLSPRASVILKPTEGSAVRAGFATAFRTPTFVESYLDYRFATTLAAVRPNSRGNRDLGPESIVSFELGYQNQDSDIFAFDLSGYYNIVSDIIALTDLDPYTLGEWRRSVYSPTYGAYTVGSTSFENDGATYRAIGGEAGVRLFPVEGLDFYVNYAYEDISQTGGPANTAALSDDQRTPRHKLNAGVQVRTRFGLDLSLDFHYVGSQRWRERVIDVARGGVAFSTFDLPDYTVLNARIGYRLLDDRLELGVVGTNLTGDHREHPFGQTIDTRVMGTAAYRF